MSATGFFILLAMAILVRLVGNKLMPVVMSTGRLKVIALDWEGWMFLGKLAGFCGFFLSLGGILIAFPGLNTRILGGAIVIVIIIMLLLLRKYTKGSSSPS